MTSSSERNLQAGFSMLEVLAVMAMVAMIAAVVVPRFSGVGTASFDNEVRSVGSMLRAARAHALAQDQPVAVAYDSRSHRLEIPALGMAHQFERSLKVHLTVPRNQQDGRVARIRFLADGLSSGGTIALTRDGRKREITVNWLGGEIAF